MLFRSRAYAESDSTYLRCPSAKIVSKAREDLPDPERPVNTIKEFRGRSKETFLRLCSRAPRITNRSSLNSQPQSSPLTLSLILGSHLAGALLIQIADPLRPTSSVR